MLRAVGWLLLSGCALCGFLAHDADRRLQVFRLPGNSASAYWFVPLRVRRELYTADGHHLVSRFWRAIGGMYALGLVAAIVLTIAYGGR